MKVCIIGAGASGIVCAKYLSQNSIAYECYEKSNDLGGLWKFREDNKGRIYRSLHINTSKKKMELEDFPFPKSYPDYPSHELIIKYFNDYIDHFNIRSSFQLNISVEKVIPINHEKNNWRVYLSNGQVKDFSDVIVANGHHDCPNIPKFEGSFTGEELHSSLYRDNNSFYNKKVLVIGIGNSAVDIACDLVSSAKKVALSTRRSAYVFPKYIFGRPLDYWITPEQELLPRKLRLALFKGLLRLSIGKQTNYGLRLPSFELDQAHPTISQDFLSYLGHGKIKIYPNIKKLEGSKIYFEDDDADDFDTVIYCTGYKINFPFFDSKMLNIEGNSFNLYKRTLHTDYSHLFFVGLVQPLGSLFPIVQWQAKWICELLKGKVNYPGADRINKNKKKQIRAQLNYVNSQRHTLQENFYPYINSIKEELKHHS